MIRRYFIFCFIVLIFVRCAQVLPLSGGEKDTQAPKIIRQYPPANTLNYSGNSVTLELDEYVVLKDIQNQWIITPPLKDFPEVNLKGKSIEIKWKETLLPDRTYTFQLGSSVSDLHEGNTLQNPKVVFSTGSNLDSASLSGNITDALTGQVAGEVSVFLYENGEDSCMFLRRPDYFSKADKDGNYRVERIHPGLYKVVALGDKNKNFIYNQSEEAVDMWYSDKKDRIEIFGAETKNFSVYRELPSRFFVKKVISNGVGKSLVVFNRPIYSPSIDLLNADIKSCKFNFSSRGDSLQLFYNDQLPDSARFVIHGKSNAQTSSHSGVFSDTFVVNRPPKVKANEIQGIQRWLNKVMRYKLDHDYDFLEIFSDEFIIQLNSSKIYFISESDTTPTQMSLTKEGHLKHSLTPSTKKQGRFLFLPGALQNQQDIFNDTLFFDFMYPDESSLSVLLVEWTPSKNKSGIIELLNERGVVTRRKLIMNSSEVNEKIIWKNLVPGNYSLRFIEDEDGNGEWTTGNLLQSDLPERVLHCQQKISLLAGWEFNLQWKME